MKVFICSNTECSTFEWGAPGREPDVNQPCIFCGRKLREVTEEEQAEADEIIDAPYLCSKL